MPLTEPHSDPDVNVKVDEEAFRVRLSLTLPPKAWSRVIILRHYMKDLTHPPRLLISAVACVAAAMLLLEVVVTRLFSVMFFYHFSFFAISLVMSGLVIGGILVSRWNVAGMPQGSFDMRLAILSAFFSFGTGAGLVGLMLITRHTGPQPSLMRVGVYAMLFLPGLVAAGGFLALAFARNARWIGKLYAADLLAAAAACIGAIAALRTLEGAAAVALTVVLAAMATLFIAPVRWMRWSVNF